MADQRPSDDQLRAVLAAAGASGSWDWDIAADRLYVDDRFAELYALDRTANATGYPTRCFFAAIHPDDRARIRIAVAGLLAGAELFSKEFRVIDPTGAVLWMHGRGQSHRDAADEPVRFTGLIVDVTERKRTEERLRVAQSAGGIGTFEYSDGFATVSVSHEFCRLLGLHPTDRLPVRTINGVLLEPARPLIPEGADNAIPAMLDGDFQIRRGDDEAIRWIARRGEVIRDGDAGGYRLLGVVYDVTDAKRREAELRGLNETLEQRVAEALLEKKVYADVVACSPAAVTVLDHQYRILAINPANVAVFDKAYGRRPEVGDNFLALFDGLPGHGDRQRAIWSRALAGEIFVVTEEFGEKEREPRWFEVRFNPLLNAEGKIIGASGTSYDVTEAKRAEGELALAQEALRQSQKMEAVGQLTGGIAHDFNNLLTIIIGSVDTATRRLDANADPRLRRALEHAAKGAERAAALTHRLLAFSRRQPLNPRILDVARLISGMSDLLSRAISESIAIVIDVPDDLWRIEADPNQLENAILNLAVNARDAMPSGGTLTISARHQRVVSETAPEGVAPGEYVAITVIDTGIGMNGATLARVFDPFFTTKEVGKGTGLGLSMVYGFARQSGGGVTVSSEPGAGTSVTLLLSRADAVVAADMLPEGNGVEQGSADETVLVVEDDDDVRAYTVGVLRELGYRVIEAHDGASALRLLDKQELPISLLMTDVVMPNMSGSELARAAVERQPGLKVLYSSGYTRDAIMHDGRLDEGVELLAKPFTFKTLARKVREILDAR
ncbi:ATP-binding protein [Flavisphingomonas formosensis]|uniref:ATP-binding protein n=1 Tax=Flavisphingomonas formosensis TaxID=861534 RepID=UPI0012F814D9|nr:ATP-binding protein [Sphingomonas formosensis]